MSEDEIRRRIGGSMQALRKAAGFKSAKAFAESMGIPSSAYTEYEQGRRNISFQRAWQIADALNCSLDDLGGRDFSPPSEQSPFADPYQAELNACYEASNAEGRSVILGTARGQRELSKKVPERPVAGSEVTMAEAM